MYRLFLTLSQMARRNAHISQHVGGIFQKAVVKFHFCVWTGGSAGFITSPSKNRGSPSPRLKNHPEFGKNGRFFVFLNGAPRILGGDVIHPSRIVTNTQNYKHIATFFEIPPTGRILGNQPPPNKTLPKKLRCFSRWKKTHVDYDFAIIIGLA